MNLRSRCACLLVFACRWGGPEGDPSALTDPPLPGGTEVTATDDDVPNGELAGTATSPEPEGDTDVTPTAPGQIAEGAVDEDGVPDGIQAGVSSADAGVRPPPDTPQSCAAPASLLCDPVSNTGCLPLMQCIADPNGGVATAQCVFAGVPLGTACTQDALSTTCAPGQTCLAGQCREYCYCDADCQPGTACTGSSGAAFRLCT